MNKKYLKPSQLVFVASVIGVILSPSSSRAATYMLGHGDIRFHFSGFSLDQTIHIDPQSVVDGEEVGNAPDGVDYLPDEVTTLVPEPSFPRPHGTEWDFIGNNPGDPVRYIPDSQEFDRPWLGVSTAGLHSADWSGFRVRLMNVINPHGGHFSLSVQSPFEIIPILASHDGIDESDQFQPNLGSHAHYLWLFSKPGSYDVTLEISGVHASAGELSSSATYQFLVIPEPSAATMVVVSMCIGAFIRRRRANRGGLDDSLS